MTAYGSSKDGSDELTVTLDMRALHVGLRAAWSISLYKKGRTDHCRGDCDLVHVEDAPSCFVAFMYRCITSLTHPVRRPTRSWKRTCCFMKRFISTSTASSSVISQPANVTVFFCSPVGHLAILCLQLVRYSVHRAALYFVFSRHNGDQYHGKLSWLMSKELQFAIAARVHYHTSTFPVSAFSWYGDISATPARCAKASSFESPGRRRRGCSHTTRHAPLHWVNDAMRGSLCFARNS